MSNDAQSERLAKFRELARKINHYDEAIELMGWDLRTGAPKKGVEGRSAVIGTLSAERFRLSISEEMKAHLDSLGQEDALAGLQPIDRRMVEECKKDYDRSVKIPPDQFEAYVVLTSQAESIWEDAKRAADFNMFRPYLEKIVAFNREFVELWGYEEHKYDALIEQYDPGMTVSKLDRLFLELRERLVPLAAAVADAADKPDTSFLNRRFDPQKQREFSMFILKEMGYDFAAGRLDESVHPFATGINLGDVRITTHFKPDDVTFALFGTIHEGGHALYEQNIAGDLVGTPLRSGASYGIHESQSRFWENFVGCSLAFWKRYFKDLQRIFPDELGRVDVESFYRAVNEATPGLIRIEADELTYNLHIMIRYEIEKALIQGEVKVEELPSLWNAKYGEYLGIVPSHDGEGVLQDVHWSGGSFGYFPSYALGNMYAAQLTHAMKRECPQYDQWIEAGQLRPIREWLTDRVHRHGKLLTPDEIIRRATGEELNPAYLTRYLEQKYKGVYRL